MMRILSLFLLTCSVSAWSSSSSSQSKAPPSIVQQQQQQHQQSRKTFFHSIATLTGAAALTTTWPAFAADSDQVVLPNGVSYKILKTGNGAKPECGELVAIRFAAYNGDVKIDDIFETPEPYYTRMGSGGLLRGVEETLPLMRLGDRWVLSIPSDMAFGKKGRPSSAGKPRIPGDATIVFDVEIVGMPGREVELIELIGE
jgi:peptidylprolyl isomerase